MAKKHKTTPVLEAARFSCPHCLGVYEAQAQETEEFVKIRHLRECDSMPQDEYDAFFSDERTQDIYLAFAEYPMPKLVEMVSGDLTTKEDPPEEIEPEPEPEPAPEPVVRYLCEICGDFEAKTLAGLKSHKRSCITKVHYDDPRTIANSLLKFDEKFVSTSEEAAALAESDAHEWEEVKLLLDAVDQINDKCEWYKGVIADLAPNDPELYINKTLLRQANAELAKAQEALNFYLEKPDVMRGRQSAEAIALRSKTKKNMLIAERNNRNSLFSRSDIVSEQNARFGDMMRGNLWVPTWDKEWNGAVPFAIDFCWAVVTNANKVKITDEEGKKVKIKKTVGELIDHGVFDDTFNERMARYAFILEGEDVLTRERWYVEEGTGELLSETETKREPFSMNIGDWKRQMKTALASWLREYYKGHDAKVKWAKAHNHWGTGGDSVLSDEFIRRTATANKKSGKKGRNQKYAPGTTQMEAAMQKAIERKKSLQDDASGEE